jgi:hypothetical protein
MLLALLQQLSLAAATSVQHVPNCSLAAPGVVDGVQTACACQSKDGKDTPMPCGPSHGLGYAASDQCMPQVCVEITTGNMKGHCHNVLCPDCGSGVIRGPGVTKFHLRDNSCGNNDPNAQFYDPVHKLYHTFFQDHLGIPQYQNPRNRSDPSDTGSWTGGVVYGHMVSRGILFHAKAFFIFTLSNVMRAHCVLPSLFSLSCWHFALTTVVVPGIGTVLHGQTLPTGLTCLWRSGTSAVSSRAVAGLATRATVAASSPGAQR